MSPPGAPLLAQREAEELNLVSFTAARLTRPSSFALCNSFFFILVDERSFWRRVRRVIIGTLLTARYARTGRFWGTSVVALTLVVVLLSVLATLSGLRFPSLEEPAGRFGKGLRLTRSVTVGAVIV